MPRKLLGLAALLLAIGSAEGRPQAAPGEPAADAGAEQPAAMPAVAELAVEVTWPRRQEPWALGPGDLVVREDGARRRIVAVGAAGPWRLVIYVDRAMSGTRTLRAAAGALAAQGPVLARMGTVEVVVAEPEPGLVLPPSREAAVLDEVLSTLALGGEGLEGPRPLRARFLERLRGAAPGEDPGALAAEGLEDEVRLVRRQTDRLLAWLAANPPHGPAALLLVSDGFDVDPAAFYRREVPGAALPAKALEEDALGLAKAVAALGWTALPLPMGDARLPDVRRFKVNPRPEGGTISMPVPRLRRRAEEAQEPEAPPLPPLAAGTEPLRLLAEATGGGLLDSPAGLAPALSWLGARVRVTYESAKGRDGAVHGVEVSAVEAGLGVRARRWDAAGVPAMVAAARARRVLDGDEEGGELAVSGSLRAAAPAGTVPREAAPSESVPEAPGASGPVVDAAPEVEGAQAAEGAPAGSVVVDGPVAEGAPAGGGRVVRIELRLDDGEAARPLRWTLAAEEGSSQGTLAPAAGTAGEPAEPGLWTAEVALPPGAEQAAVVVDDPAGGAWGSALVAVPAVEEPGERMAFSTPVIPAAPRPEAAPAGGLAVRILRPQPGRASGPVEVEVAVDLPRDGRLDRVELFWNDELAATLRRGPLRARVAVPPGRRGYLRAVARLEDGTLAEDAVPLNAGDLGERIDVRLAQLYVVVTDRSGHPVRGLGKEDFRIRQGGLAQPVAGLDEAGQLPITVGLAIDSSASMFLKLPQVQDAARSLLGEGLAPRDSALLIDYDTEPRLVRSPTRNLIEVSRGLDVLRADGGSNLMRAVVFSLGQLATLPGRKALVLYSDGVDEGEDVSFQKALRAARRAGVPVYLILTGSSAGRAERKGIRDFALRSYAERLERLAASTGGRLYAVGPRDDVGAVYREILAELRSQYVVSFYPSPAAGTAEVQVEVSRPGLTARTMRGGTVGRSTGR